VGWGKGNPSNQHIPFYQDQKCNLLPETNFRWQQHHEGGTVLVGTDRDKEGQEVWYLEMKMALCYDDIDGYEKSSVLLVIDGDKGGKEVGTLEDEIGQE
jgi:hypothetical protein